MDNNRSSDEKDEKDSDKKLVPPEFLISDPDEEDIYCSVGIVTPLTFKIAKKIATLIDLGYEQWYQTLSGQCCLAFDDCKTKELKKYGKMYIHNNLYKIPIGNAEYYYTTLPSEDNPNPTFGTGSGMDAVYLIKRRKEDWKNILLPTDTLWGDLSDYVDIYCKRDKLFQFVMDNTKKCIDIIGIKLFTDIFNRNNYLHWMQYYDVFMRDKKNVYNITTSTKLTKNYVSHLKDVNGKLMKSLFKLSTSEQIANYSIKLNNPSLARDSLYFEIYIHIKKMQDCVLECSREHRKEGSQTTSRLSMLPLDIIKMINERILS